MLFLIQCDEAKPSCRRCDAREAPCPGYRDTSIAVFREVTVKHFRIGQRGPRQSSPSRPPNVNYTQKAVAHYFANFVLSSSHGFTGFLEYLPHLYYKNAHVNHLVYAVHAVATANFALYNGFSSSGLVQARHLYVSALEHLRRALGTNAGPSSSTVLAAVLLLWKFEIITGHDFMGNQSNPHSDGQVEILRRCLSSAPVKNDMERSTLAIVRMQGVVESASILPNLPSPATNTVDSGWACLQEILARLPVIQAEVLSLVPTVATPGEMESCFLELQQIQTTLNGIKMELSTKWQSKIFSNPFPEQQGVVPWVFVYPDIVLASVALAHQLALLATLRGIRTLASYFPAPCSIDTDLTDQILSTIANICAIIPYLLGNISQHGQQAHNYTPAMGAFIATGALHMMTQDLALTAGQTGWILAQLYEIGMGKGIRKALALRARIIEQLQLESF